MRKLSSKLMHHSWRLLLAIVGGSVSGLALPRYYQWYFIFISVAAILLAIRNRGFWRAYGLGAVAGACFYASQSTWMTAYLGPAPWLALATLESIIFGFGIALIALVWHLLEARITDSNSFKITIISAAISAIWVTREWFACNFPYGGYGWSRLAQAHADNVFSRWAYWGGLSAISFVSAFISTALLLLILHRRKRPWITLTALALTIVIPSFTFLPSQSKKTINIASVQGNANAGLFANPDPGSILVKHLKATDALMADPDFKSVQVVVWPENSSDIDPIRNQSAKSLVEGLVNEKLKVPLVLGAVTFRGSEIFNTVLQFNPNQSVVDYYDKRRPVPFAEYVPDRPFWYALAPDLIGLISHGYSFGQQDGILDLAGTKAGTLICFEITIDEVVHDLVTGGAQVIFSQANNSDFGKTDETYQQEAFARLQAIATGRSVVHVSTVGVTEMIRPDGSISKVLPAFEPGYLIDELALMTELTPAMRFYGWVDLVSGFATLILAGWAVVWRFRNKEIKPGKR